MSKYIAFEQEPQPAKAKTRRWTVVSRVGASALGQVAWFPRWRKYVFVPAASTVFDQGCMRDIADFCENQTLAHKVAQANAA